MAITAEDTNKEKAVTSKNIEALWTQEIKVPVKDTNEEYDYDTAISAAGHGKYHYLLMLAAVFPVISCLLSTSTVSFILPSAECDLQLTNFDKGLLNAITYIGMICTAFVWGFLSDTLGRQKLLVLGFGLDAIFNFIAGLAQDYYVLLVAKLADGLICAGPYAILMTYLAECNPDSHRASVVQYSGLFTALGTVLLPLLAWVILPVNIELFFFASMYLPSWRIFLLLSTIPSAVGAITFYYRWESPKFLLSKGRKDEALSILRRMYVINTGNTPESYPIKSLRVELSEAVVSSVDQKSSLRALLMGLNVVKPLFKPPYLSRALLVFMFQFGALLGYNTIRLWMPQLFATIMKAERFNIESEANTVCGLIGGVNSTNDMDIGLSCPVVDDNVYINSIIIGLVTAVGFLAAGYLTRYIGDISLILCGTAGSVASCLGMYWAVSSKLMLTFSSIFVTATSISSTAILSVTILLFPTETRTMAVALVMMFGQIGGMLGNVLFPVLLDWNCAVPFFMLAALLSGTGVIVLFLPRGKGAQVI